MVPHQVLVEMLGGEARVALPIEPPDLVGLVLRHRPARATPETPVQQPVLALLLEPPRPAPDRALAHPNDLRRLKLAQPASLPARQHVTKLQHPHTLPLLRPPHPNLHKADRHPTDHVLPKPDRSHAPYRAESLSLRTRSLPAYPFGLERECWERDR